ncbi:MULTISPECIES: GrrA/OscA1 family cyclophane-containing rSAM-modified RiPP [unclassified Cyanobium]|uniref:GrrA/OscA1 family cyclophane-containing rSAM-modified RiPP n=1 Tax=unclassified Cyanobium TaxID=2627006 RepID=UPI0020CE301F|nr:MULTISPECIES: GrrA/OscA1 family cyclophane-containing rSAM-modified RiPP [unclassified Cyanobium]MCP9833909.1 rSAM-associated Gly-rich repeat protein [Cyanobium sp. La Preciosa 7G6]MCP9936673.1 rSAM-associated Gly-rich repeat protein [Cyanobium sp. Aljojuca 7A6]
MSITSRTALLGFSLALAALTAPAAGQAAVQPTSATGSIEQRLQRITAAIRDQGDLSGADGASASDQRLAYGFANAGRGGFANAARGGFANAHPYYGGGGGFRNGGGGFVNARGGGGFVNGGGMRGGAFRNW